MIQTQAQAGPSTYIMHGHSRSYPNTSTANPNSGHSSTSSYPSHPSPNRVPTHVQAIHDFDPALLSSTSNPGMYLSFNAGEIIRVHVRDATGWWDGEIGLGDMEVGRKGPRRGWFPSNYVREMGWDVMTHKRNVSATSTTTTTTTSPKSRKNSMAHSRHTSSTSQHSRTFTATSTNHIETSPRNSQKPPLPESLQTLLQLIVQSLSLLESAIHSNHKTHIQPSTACVISSIRAALMQTDCLTKESPTLVNHPVLAKERKIVLVELSKLVACARSSSTVSDDGGDDRKELEALAKAARGVFSSVKRFLHLADDCGVEPTLTEPTEVGPIQATSRSQSGAGTPTDESVNASIARQSREPSGNARIQEAFRQRAASIADLRAARRRQSSPPPPMPASAALLSRNSSSMGRTRSPSLASTKTPTSAGFASSSSGRSSPISANSLYPSVRSADSSYVDVSTPSSDRGSPREEVTPISAPHVDRQLGSVSDVYDAIGLAEDALLSIIAAFIGHLHSHHISSHPSSHAHLIEMTRETIDSVRELLSIVEKVGRHTGVRLARPREVETLRVAKDLLYEVASKLVEGAESVANAPFSEGGEEGYDGEKGRLLQAATGTLRAGTECVRLVKLCLPADETILLPPSSVMATPRQGLSEGANRQSTPRPAEAAVVLRDNVVGVRGTHTLSGLHRKATSLSTLQKRYLNDGFVSSPQEEEEDEDDEDDEEGEEVVQDVPSRDEELTMMPVHVPVTKTFPPTPVRPHLQTIRTSPGRVPQVQRPDMLRSNSDFDRGTRSRSSSLISPAAPRVQHRSPSRSADLDKFTIPGESETLGHGHVRRISETASITRPRHSSQRSAGSFTETSTRSSGVTELHTPTLPPTPIGESSPGIGYLKTDVPALGSFGKSFRLSLDIDATPGRTLTQTQNQSQEGARPMVNRASTAPISGLNSTLAPDARFWVVAHDYDPREISFNSDGQIIGASLAVLVEKMTPHDGPVEPIFWATFFCTIRLHTSPSQLVEALIERYQLQPPPSVVLVDQERALWIERKVVPVRMRIYNFLKTWLDSHWIAKWDDGVLERLRDFAKEVVMRTLPAYAPRLIEAIRKRSSGPLSSSSTSTSTSGVDTSARSIKRSSSTDKLRLLNPIVPPTGLPPTPIISKSLNSLLSKSTTSMVSIPITEFDTLELARQLTILESRLFQAVLPEDLITSVVRKKEVKVSELKALSLMSNQLTGWVADGILGELDAKKRAGLLKWFIKLADKCLTLNNFSSFWAVLAGLNNSTILRLKKTWDALSSKYRVMMDRLRVLVEHTKNHIAYRTKLREVQGPCLPFLGLILTDITFTTDGNPDTRPSVLAPDMMLINQDKYTKLGKIALEFQRYQQPFNFHELEGVQTFLRAVLAERGSADVEDLYRKSLMLEPRQGSENVGVGFERPGWLGGRI